MTYPSYFPEKYKHRPPEYRPQAKAKIKPIQIARHFRRNKHHYEFIALSIILAFLSALAITLSQHN